MRAPAFGSASTSGLNLSLSPHNDERNKSQVERDRREHPYCADFIVRDYETIVAIPSCYTIQHELSAGTYQREQ